MRKTVSTLKTLLKGLHILYSDESSLTIPPDCRVKIIQPLNRHPTEFILAREQAALIVRLWPLSSVIREDRPSATHVIQELEDGTLIELKASSGFNVRTH